MMMERENFSNYLSIFQTLLDFLFKQAVNPQNAIRLPFPLLSWVEKQLLQQFSRAAFLSLKAVQYKMSLDSKILSQMLVLRL